MGRERRRSAVKGARAAGSALRLRWTQVSRDRHRFEAECPDGRVVSRELELKSMLVHDFVHLAVESEAGLRDSFFGSLCCEPSEGAYHELPQTEKVVGALQGALKGTVNPAEFVDRLAAYLDDVGDEVPKWLTPELVGRAVGRFRQIHGHWKATPFGQTMELTFPLDPI